MPAGAYEIMGRSLVINPVKPGFRDDFTGRSWFLPVEPLFMARHTGLGIHPDEYPPGTEGCVGLQGRDAYRFWVRWVNLPIDRRPERLYVY